MSELNELLASGTDTCVQEFIYRYFIRFTKRGMSDDTAAQTIIELCDEFFGFWRLYPGEQEQELRELNY